MIITIFKIKNFFSNKYYFTFIKTHGVKKIEVKRIGFYKKIKIKN